MKSASGFFVFFSECISPMCYFLLSNYIYEWANVPQGRNPIEKFRTNRFLVKILAQYLVIGFHYILYTLYTYISLMRFLFFSFFFFLDNSKQERKRNRVDCIHWYTYRTRSVFLPIIICSVKRFVVFILCVCVCVVNYRRRIIA